ncbi:MAG: hypothetical protein ACRDZP_08875 [Acidimicrobiales bacterium]
MTTIARRFACTPERTASETWAAIVDLLAPTAGVARDELVRAAGAISMLIADEVTKDRPLVVSGSGPQVRVYTVHGGDAIDGSGVTEAPLARDATTGAWTLSVPVPEEDAEWVSVQLAQLPHVSVVTPVTDAKAAPPAVPPVPVIDLSELRSR